MKKKLGVTLCQKITQKNTTKPNNHDYNVIEKSKVSNYSANETFY